MLFAYRITINLIILFSPIIFFIRLLKKKEDPKRFKEKFCFFTKKRRKGKLIWFHGASVGEILSVVPLIQELEKDKSVHSILVTSNTLSSSKIINTIGFKKTIHQFFPIDNLFFVKKFLKYWSPTLAIFIDSEIWPHMLINIKKESIPLVLLNGRINKKSFRKWARLGSTAKNLFSKFDLCLPSSNETKKHLKLLGAKNIKYIGNLKFTESKSNTSILNEYSKKFFLSKRIWCASSTHDIEENICAKTHIRLKKKYKNILTIIIPRHINRVPRIINELEELNLKVHLHSSGDKIHNNTDIYLVDAYGKTKMFFSICNIVFLGGSLIGHGGQNPLEAARYNCRILHGPNIWNFSEIYSLLKRLNVSQRVLNKEQFGKKISNLLDDKGNKKNIQSKLNLLSKKILKLTLIELNYQIIKQ